LKIRRIPGNLGWRIEKHGYIFKIMKLVFLLKSGYLF